MPRQVISCTDELCQEDFPKAIFKALYEKSKEQLLS